MDFNAASERDTNNFVTKSKFFSCRSAIENRELSRRDKTINQVDCIFFDGKKTGALSQKKNKKKKRTAVKKGDKADLYAIIREISKEN